MTVHSCGRPIAHINGRTYKAALRELRRDYRSIRRDQLTDWVSVCPRCDGLNLGATRSVGWPFRDADGVMRTVHDYDDDGFELREDSEPMSFGGFLFSRRAFEAGVHLAQTGDPQTLTVEAKGRDFLARPTTEAARVFCEAVCVWGRGQRVLGKLRVFHGDTLGRHVHDWLVRVPNLDPLNAIAAGSEIKGLAVSFASKHLRLLQPERFPVLDEVLEAGLGIACNPAGYRRFTHMLSDFLAEHQLQQTIALAEGAIFTLVRQGVRAIERN